MNKMTSRIQGQRKLIILKTVKRTKKTMTKMAKAAKKQSLKVILVGQTMKIMSQIMNIMNKIVKNKSAKRNHLMKKKMTITVRERLMRVPKTVTPQRVQAMVQRLNLTVNTVCQMMKRRIVMKLEMYQAMIKAPLILQR